jgi:glycerol uptake facilitator-like aquaporin
MKLAQRLLAEGLGTGGLLAAVVGSGIMGAALSNGNDAIALLANAGATAAILYVLIAVLGPISGAHFNPVVTMLMRLRGELGTMETVAYIVVQIVAAIGGVMLAHAMFGQALLQPGTDARTGMAQWLSEGVATAGLLLTIVLGLRSQPSRMPALVASYIFAAYWFTASTSFANPAVTVARAFTRTFAGIRTADVPEFVLAQLLGTVAALAVAFALDDRSLHPERRSSALS